MEMERSFLEEERQEHAVKHPQQARTVDKNVWSFSTVPTHVIIVSKGQIYLNVYSITKEEKLK
jgi:hypothetical protein